MNKFFILLLSSVVALQTKLFTTPIFSFMPKLKLHHIVLLSKSTDKNIFNNNIINDVYIIDYTPLEDINLKTGLKLFLGEKIKGRVRIVHMNKINKTTLIDDWYNETKFNTLNKLDDENINEIIRKWDTKFQFYGNNCQHFGKYMINEFDRLKF
jgi:hypothetical protein